MVNETLKPSHIRLNNKRLNLLNNYELIQFVTADAFLLIRTPTQKPSCVLIFKFILVPSSTATHHNTHTYLRCTVSSKNPQIPDKEALKKPQVLATEALSGHVTTDSAVLQPLKALRLKQDCFMFTFKFRWFMTLTRNSNVGKNSSF